MLLAFLEELGYEHKALLVDAIEELNEPAANEMALAAAKNKSGYLLKTRTLFQTTVTRVMRRITGTKKTTKRA